MNEGFEFTLHALKFSGARFRFALKLLGHTQGRTPEKVGAPGVRWSHGVAASSEEEARRRRRRRKRRERGLGLQEEEEADARGGFSRQGGRRNKGYVKLPHCPSLLSFIRPKVVHT